MRILTIASEAPPIRSGVAVSVGRVVDGAREAGHEVEVRSYVDAPSLIADQVRLSALGIRMRRRMLNRFDLIHLHGPAPSVSDLILARRSIRSVPVPILYTHHFTVAGGGALVRPFYKIYDGVARRLARAANATVATTEAYADLLDAAGVKDVTVVPWGVDLPSRLRARSLTNDDDPLRVLVLGQMRRYKGHHVAAEAIGDVPGMALTLAGAGELEPAIRLATANAANIQVVADPSDDEVESLYLEHDVILLPSTSAAEAFGMVLLEGMARGCVPVASDLPGLGDVIADTGALASAGDPVDLRRVLTAIAQDRSRLHRLSGLAQDRASLFTWDRTIADYLRLYDRVVYGSS